MVEVEDIEKSPVTSKAGNSLRLTKSEENLSTNPDSDSDSCCWAQEDEDITLQVCLQLGVILILIFIGFGFALPLASVSLLPLQYIMSDTLSDKGPGL